MSKKQIRQQKLEQFGLLPVNPSSPDLGFEPRPSPATAAIKIVSIVLSRTPHASTDPIEEGLDLDQSNLIIIVSEPHHWNSSRRSLHHENDAKIVLLIKRIKL